MSNIKKLSEGMTPLNPQGPYGVDKTSAAIQRDYIKRKNIDDVFDKIYSKESLISIMNFGSDYYNLVVILSPVYHIDIETFKKQIKINLESRKRLEEIKEQFSQINYDFSYFKNNGKNWADPLDLTILDNLNLSDIVTAFLAGAHCYDYEPEPSLYLGL